MREDKSVVSHKSRTSRRSHHRSSKDTDDSSQNDRSLTNREHYLYPDTLNEIPQWLQPAHFVAAMFQFLQAIILFYFASSDDQARWDVYTNYPIPHEFNSNEHGPPFAERLGSVSLTMYSAIFILLSGIDHALCSSPWFRQQNEFCVQRSFSPNRWYEYSVSAALMRVSVSQIVGMTDLHLLICQFFLTTGTVMLGASHELINARARADGGYKQNWMPYWVACVLQIVSWGLIFWYMSHGNSVGSNPNYVMPIVITMFFFDGSFAILFALQWLSVGIFKDFVFGEFCFIMMSFTAKTFLAWIVYGTAASSKLL